MTIAEIIEQMRDGLDDMAAGIGTTDPEWAKINAIRFVENYRIMRSMELEAK